MTAPVTLSPAVTYQQMLTFARICATAGDDVLEQATPAPEVEAAIAEAFPGLSRPVIDRLWDRGRIDAAALHQLNAGDVHRWPVCDMDPARRLSARYVVFLDELESSVEWWLREAFAGVTA